MKDIFFNLLEQVVVAEHGEAAWEGMREGTGLAGTFASPGGYPDDEMAALMGAAGRFHEHAAVDHVTCMERGDERCELTVRTFALVDGLGDAA